MAARISSYELAFGCRATQLKLPGRANLFRRRPVSV
jgi:hypothetical protein